MKAIVATPEAVNAKTSIKTNMRLGFKAIFKSLSIRHD